MKLHFTILLLLLTYCQNAQAWHWQDLWWRADEQGYSLFKKGKFASAAERFQNPEWRGVALYRAGQYQKAMQALEGVETPKAHYNRGNSLAHMGQIDAAIDAYEDALELNPDFEDAKINLEILKKLQKQQQSKQQNQKNEKQRSKQASKSQNNSNTQDQKRANQKQSQQANNQQQSDNNNQTKSQSNPQHTKNKPDQNKNSQNEKNNKSKQDQEKSLQANGSKQDEKKQSQQQWLRRIPDDPGGLLRHKILREHLNRHRQNAQTT
jgi:Ca-activated chloride channel homolog